MWTMSELNEQRWAIISQRGVEASALTYEDALKLIRRLSAEKVSSLAIVSNEAAERDAEKSGGKARPGAVQNGER
jgi:hypothetical protein